MGVEMNCKMLILFGIFSSTLLMQSASNTQGFEYLEGFDELDEYGGGEGQASETGVLECLLTEHKDEHNVRWSDELAATVQKNMRKIIQLSFYSRKWKGKFQGLDALVYKVHGTNHESSKYVCEDFGSVKRDKIREISVKDGAAEVGCGVRILGNSATVVCLYRTGITGYIPI